MGVRPRPAKSGLNTNGPSTAPATAPKRTSEIWRGRLSGGNHVRRGSTCKEDGAVRDPDEREAEDHERRRIPETAERGDGRAGDTASAARGKTESARAGPSAARGQSGQGPVERKIAGPSPRIPSMPVTTTSVVVATATTSWIIPDRQTSVADSSSVFRLTGYARRAGVDAASSRSIYTGRLGSSRPAV